MTLPRWYGAAAAVSSVIAAGVYVFRFVCLVTMENFGSRFPVLFIGKLTGIANCAACVLLGFLMIDAIRRIAEKYTEFSYRPYGIILPLAILLLSVESIFPYLFLSEPVWVTVGIWAVFAALLYCHKKSLDEMQAEIEYKLM